MVQTEAVQVESETMKRLRIFIASWNCGRTYGLLGPAMKTAINEYINHIERAALIPDADTLVHMLSAINAIDMRGVPPDEVQAVYDILCGDKKNDHFDEHPEAEIEYQPTEEEILGV